MILKKKKKKRQKEKAKPNVGVDFVILSWNEMTKYFDGDTKEWLKKSTTKWTKLRNAIAFD